MTKNRLRLNKKLSHNNPTNKINGNKEHKSMLNIQVNKNKRRNNRKIISFNMLWIKHQLNRRNNNNNKVAISFMLLKLLYTVHHKNIENLY